MGDGPIPAGRGMMPGQIAEVIVTLDGEPGRRASGYRVGPTSVLTAAHVIEGAASVRVRFDADLPGERTAEVTSCWADPRSDLAVLSIAPCEGEPPVVVARFGRTGGGQAAVLAARTVGFPRFKLKSDDGVEDHPQRYRDSHQADGSVAVLSNRREGTLEITVLPPEHNPDPGVSPWEGMSGAAVWVADRIVGVIAKHHRSDGLGRLAATRLDLALAGLDQARRAELRTLLGLPDVLPDVVPPSAGERVTTAYQAQVRDIAPDRLLDRDAELDELVEFCAGDQPYAWWQAGPWAGKSALLASFVLHRPAGVDVVSFFVTARLAGQSDSGACTDALIEQLAALVGESPAALLTAGARRGTMLRLLEDAANRAREAGRRLLLVIDGLDEDSGGATGPSIAALLPRRPPAEVRVLVASRPHPPIPDDVADDHPLRTISPRQLDVSEHARNIEHRAKHELTQLLVGEQLKRDVLGLITAAGGGLTLDDLEQLTERPPFEIENLLGGLFGRSVGSRIGATPDGSLDERVYLFTHETLRVVAEQQYGNSLAAYRDRLHTWADSYRQRGWSTDTPQYLLRSYPRMLASNGDLTRLVACATDQARHDRMRDLTGGDAIAVTEISTAQQLILAQPDPDLTSLALLAVQRDHITDRNSHIPTNLPAVWAMLGQPTRAEALADSIPDPDERAQALRRLVEVAAGSGDRDRAARLASAVEAVTVHIADPSSRAQALGQLTVVVARSGDCDRAARLADQAARVADEAKILITQIPDSLKQDVALCDLIEAVAVGGDHDRAETFITQITEPALRAEALSRLATLAAGGSDRARAARLSGEAERLIPQSIDPVLQGIAWSKLVEAVAVGGDHNRAETLTTQITEPALRAEALSRLAWLVTAGSDQIRAVRLIVEAEALIGQMTDLHRKAEALCQLAEVVYTNGNRDRAADLLSEAEALTMQLTDHYEYERAEALCQLADAIVITGDRDHAARLSNEAEALAEQITHSYERADVLCQLADMVVADGERDRAVRLLSETEALTGQLTNPYPRTLVLGRLADVVAHGGDYSRAEVLIARITDPGSRSEALGRLAEVVAEGGDHDQTARLISEAKALTAQLTDPYQRALALSRLANAVFACRDEYQADRLVNEAEALAVQLIDPRRRAPVFGRLAKLAAAGCDYDRAEALIAQIVEPGPRAGALGQLAEAVDADGDHGRADRLVREAEALTDRISNRYQRAEALASLAVTLWTTTENSTPIREHPHMSSPALVRSRSLFAEALAIGSWSAIVFDLALIDPSAVSALADELEVRWKLDSPGGPPDGRER